MRQTKINIEVDREVRVIPCIKIYGQTGWRNDGYIWGHIDRHIHTYIYIDGKIDRLIYIEMDR